MKCVFLILYFICFHCILSLAESIFTSLFVALYVFILMLDLSSRWSVGTYVVAMLLPERRTSFPFISRCWYHLRRTMARTWNQQTMDIVFDIRVLVK